MNAKTMLHPLLAAASAAALTLGLTLAPAHAGTPWLVCPDKTTPVYKNADGFTRMNTPDGELFFQACKNSDGSLQVAQVGYDKKRGKPEALAFGWRWVNQIGKAQFDLDYRGDYRPVPGEFGEFATLAAGQDHTFTRTRPAKPGSGYPIDVQFQRPKAPFTCLQGYIFGYKDFDYATNHGTLLETRSACL